MAGNTATKHNQKPQPQNSYKTVTKHRDKHKHKKPIKHSKKKMTTKYRYKKKFSDCA